MHFLGVMFNIVDMLLNFNFINPGNLLKRSAKEDECPTCTSIQLLLFIDFYILGNWYT